MHQYQNRTLALGKIQIDTLEPIVKKKSLKSYKSGNILFTSHNLRKVKFKQFVLQELLTGR